MPSKYRIRNYKENSFYHIFNKSLGNTKIFLDDEDYKKFLYYLEIYLIDPTIEQNKKEVPKRLLQKNLKQDVEIISYLLLPNHFHLVFKQATKNGIARILKQIINGYTYYFNNKYQNSGSIFAGKFRSVKIELENLVEVSKHIHAHPGILWLSNSLKSYPWSSYNLYLDSKLKSTLNKEYVLSQFSSLNEFKKLHENNSKPSDNLKHILID